MDGDYLSLTMKIVAGAASSVLGIIGVLVSYRDQYGTLNRWGKVVIGLIAASGVVTIALTVLDARAAKKASESQEAQNGLLLADIDRSLNPISNFSVFYELRAPVNGPLFRPYNRWLAERVRKAHLDHDVVAFDKAGRMNPRFADATRRFAHYRADATAIGLHGEVLDLEIDRGSRLLPQTMRNLTDVLMSTGSTLAFFKVPRPPARLTLVFGGPHSADFIVPAFPDPESRNSITFEPRRGGVALQRLDRYESKFAHSNGQITSILDLAGSQILFAPRVGTGLTCELGDGQSLSDFKLTVLMLEVGAGRTIRLDPAKMTRSIGEKGCPLYSYTLPKDRASFMNMFSAVHPDGDEL